MVMGAGGRCVGACDDSSLLKESPVNVSSISLELSKKSEMRLKFYSVAGYAVFR